MTGAEDSSRPVHSLVHIGDGTLGMAIEVNKPLAAGRWRWLLCYWLIKLAARVYPFELSFYRTRTHLDDVADELATQ